MHAGQNQLTYMYTFGQLRTVHIQIIPTGFLRGHRPEGRPERHDGMSVLRKTSERVESRCDDNDLLETPDR